MSEFEHLEDVLGADFFRRKKPGRKHSTHCKRGHAYTPENTIWSTDRLRKKCRTCANDQQRERHRRTRALKARKQ